MKLLRRHMEDTKKTGNARCRNSISKITRIYPDSNANSLFLKKLAEQAPPFFRVLESSNAPIALQRYV